MQDLQLAYHLQTTLIRSTEKSHLLRLEIISLDLSSNATYFHKEYSQMEVGMWKRSSEV